MSKHRPKPSKRTKPKGRAVYRMVDAPGIPLHAIPFELLGQKLCVFEECLKPATQTICDEPQTCYRATADDGSVNCRTLVACDQHAKRLGQHMYEVINHPEHAVVEPRPLEGLFRGHD